MKSLLNNHTRSARTYAGLAGTCVFALAVLFACSKGGGGKDTPDPIDPAPVVPATPTPSTNTQTNPNAVWLAQDAAAVKLDSLGALLRSEAVTTPLTHLTRDAETGTVWALGGNTLYVFQPAIAAVAATLTLPDPTTVTHLATVPRSGALWIARGTNLNRVDKTGAVVTPVALDNPLSDLLAESLHGNVWAATATAITAYDGASGAETNSLRFKGAGPQHIAFDASLDALWVATADTLALYASDFSARLPPLNLAQPGITHLASDDQGKVWLATASQIAYLDSSGAQQFALDLSTLFTAGSSLIGLAANPADRSVWAATATQLVRIKADGTAGTTTTVQGHSNALAVFADAQAPKLTLTLPGPGAYLNSARPAITATLDEVGSGLDISTAKLLLENVAATATCEIKTANLVCTPTTALGDGGVNVKLSGLDFAGNSGESAGVFFTVDTVVPQITVSNPVSGLLTNAATLPLSGTLSEAARLTLNGNELELAFNLIHSFSSNLTLAEGINTYTLVATDLAGNPAQQVLQITRDSMPPAAAPSNLLTVSTISNGNVTVTGAANSAEAGAKVTVTNTRTNATVTVTVAANGSFSAMIAVQNGDVLRVVVNDAANNPSPATNITAGTATTPDPSTVAPPVDRTVASDILTTTAFLYTGANPIQTGVAPGTIELKRVAVLRGKVALRDGNPLASVKISVLGHPELGQTLTRTDGMFDLAVNGGGQLTLRYEKDGLLAAQRNVIAPWRDYAWLPDVVMIGFDSAVTAIDLSATTLQVARGNPVTDSDGTRQATILIPTGTTATMVLPNGTTAPLTTLNVRATEYTVGASGPKAMPASLPPSSGYTYAAELSVDEAVAAGATEVKFSQALPVYVENFLGFPVGGAVPTGYYDRQKGQWIASANGRVIKVLSITNSMADLDIDGTNVAATAAALTALGVTDQERTRLATLYAAGQTLWRVPITHFTPWDCNWPYGPPADAVPPPPPVQDKPPVDDPKQECGSVIGCEDQTLGESVPVSGTPWRLHYKSDRTPGRKDANTITIPVSGATPLPASLRAIRIEVNIAGRRYQQTFAPAPNLNYTVVWDGLDGYGRALQGAQTTGIQVFYDYVPQYYAVRSNFVNSFARAEAAGVAVTGNRAASTVTLSKIWTEQIGSWDARALGMGGLSLSAQHAYDPTAHMLLLGDGRQRRAEALSKIITTIAGNGTFGTTGIPNGDGGPATEAQLAGIFEDVSVGPDGSVYITEWASGRVRRVDSDGIISTVAGNGTLGVSGDGGPATAAQLANPRHTAVASDGSLYIAEIGQRGGTSPFVYSNRIRRVGPDGIITTVAGTTGPGGFSGDGGPATAAQLNAPMDVAVGHDGSLFIADRDNSRVRRVGPDGIITTVAGNGVYGFSGDGGPATAASLNLRSVTIAVGPDGSLYISEGESNRIRRVTPDGIITTVAGNGVRGFSGDGGPATAARLAFPSSVSVAADGAFYIADFSNVRIRRVGLDGIITTLAGNGTYGFSGDFGQPTAAQLSGAHDVAVGPNGNLFIADRDNVRVRRVAPALLDVYQTDILVSSEDGSELYIFNSTGRHLRTMDALTGALRYQFSYSTDGYLTSVTDASGNVTTIERSGAIPTAIVAPGGQRTALNVGADGWLLSSTNPANETHSMSYSPDGLLQTFTGPRGDIHTFTYDALGRLLKDADPVGGSTTLARTQQSNGYTVTTTSALGRTHVYQVEQLSTGAMRRTVTGASGTKTVTLINTDGSEQTTYADGSSSTVTYGPDPRFGMLAPVASSVIVKTPGGLTRTVTTTRTATLTDPNNVLSLTKLTDTVSDNGVVSARVYTLTGNTRTLTTTTPAGRSSTVTLDALGRMTQAQALGLEPVSYSYDSRGLLSSIVEGSGAGSRTTSLTYNTAYELTGVTDPLARTLGLAYDSAGRLTTQTLPGARTVTFAYDAAGNTTAITPPGRTAHSFAYTPIDQAASYTPPDLGSGSTATQYSYNTDRALTRKTRPDGQLVDITYDTAARISALGIARGLLSYSYNATTDQLTGITAPDGLGLSYSYDSDLLTGVTWSGAVVGSTAYTYNNDLRVTAESVNTASSVSYGYDVDGLLSAAGSLALIRNAQNGLRTGSTLGNVTDSLTYNTLGELTNYSASYTTTGIYNAAYSHDALGRITQKVETVNGVAATYGYSYDPAGRLSAVSKDSAPFSTYSYDSNGNRTAHTGPSVSASYDAQDRLTSYGANTYSYTANGELLSKTNGTGVTSYQYDALGNLLKVTLPSGTVIDYLIDGTNRRIGKKVNGALMQGFLYQGALRPVAELDSSNTVVSRFVYATHVNVPDYLIKGGVTYRLITDQLGSPRLVVDVATGTVAQRIDYDEFGQVLSDTNPGFQPFGFAGGLYDRDTQLVRFGARDYNAETGRWTAKDPIGFAGGDGNIYAYVGNNPVMWTDPSGLRVKFVNKYRNKDSARKLNELKNAYDKLKASKAFGKSCEALEKGNDITLTTDNLFPKHSYDAYTGEASINLNPDAIVETPTTEGWQPTPLDVQLGHELGHEIERRAETNGSEMDVIKKYENPYRAERALPARTDHRGRVKF